MANRGIGFKSLTEQVATTTPGGKLVFHVLGALAEFEHDLTRERAHAGLAAARARGRIGGRPKKLALAQALYDGGQMDVDTICRTLGVSRTTLYRYRKPQPEPPPKEASLGERWRIIAAHEELIAPVAPSDNDQPPRRNEAMDRSEPSAALGSVQYVNPPSLHTNPAFTQVVVATGPVKTVYVGMQCAVDGSRQVVGRGDLAAQTEQVLANVGACLAAAGARPEHLVAWTICVLQGQPIEQGLPVWQRWWGDRPNPPANTVLLVAGFPNPDFLVGIEAVAVVPLPA